MSSWDQFPFIVSQMPYRTAKAAKTQNSGGIPAPRPPVARSRAPACSGSRALMATRATSRAEDMTGRPHQNPRPTKMATNTGARAVPSPSSALSASTEASTRSGWNAAVRVLRAGTVRPNPAPRHAVAASSSP